MKKIVLLGIIQFVFFTVYPGAGFYQDAGNNRYNKVVFDFGSGQEWKRADTEIEGVNYGSKHVNDTWKLIGGEGFVWKNNGSDITSVTLHYRIYKQGETAPSFSNVNLPWDSDLGGNNQRWASASSDIDLLASATSPGTWIIEVYYSAATNGVDCDNQIYWNNSGSNYSLNFTSNIIQSSASGNWNTSGNWHGTTVPTSTYSVRISNDIDVDVAAETHSMLIESGSVLSIDPTKSLTVSNSLINNNGNTGLVLEATSSGSASLIQPSDLVNATVECYLTQTDYHYISSPVNNQDISTEFVNTSSNPLPATVDFYKFDEPANLWRNIKDGTGNLNVSFETQFEESKGYAYANSDAIYTKNFSGVLNYDNQTFTLEKEGSQANNGWNMVGNPYPATLAINNSADATNNLLNDNIAVLDAAYVAIYRWNGSDYTATNQASPSEFLAPAQGFFVKASADNSQFAFNTTVQKHGASTYYKTGNGTARISIGITGPQNDYNETGIAFIPGTTKGLDPGYDARKLKGNPNLALYSLLVDDDGGDYNIQSLPVAVNHQVYLGLDANQPGVYQFGNIQMNNLPYQEVLLEDKLENVFVNLNLNSSYSFPITQATSIEDRFMLHFGGIITDMDNASENDKSITIISDGDLIYLQNLSIHIQEGFLKFFSPTGQLMNILDVSLEAHSHITIPANYASGVYLVSFISGSSVVTQKVILK